MSCLYHPRPITQFQRGGVEIRFNRIFGVKEETEGEGRHNEGGGERDGGGGGYGLGKEYNGGRSTSAQGA